MTARNARMNRVLAALTLVLALAMHARAADLVIYTEHYPPYNYADKGGAVTGLATRNVRQVLDRSGLSYSLQVVPWARAYRHALMDKNALIYSLTRTPGRERQFDWLVPLAPSTYYFFARADERRPVTPEALRRGEFTAACVSGDLACEMVRASGIPEGKMVAIGSSITSDFRMVIAGRADLYISDLLANDNLRRKEGFNPRLTKAVLRVPGEAGFYLAAGKQVPEAVRTKIRTAFKALEQEGAYRQVEVSPPVP